MSYPKPYRPQQPEDLTLTPPKVYVSEGRTWEYKCITRNLAVSEPPSTTKLNNLGKDGWELCTMVTHGDTLYCYLKRLT